MYKTILVTLECTATDRAIIEHIKMLAAQLQSRVILLHVVASVSAKYHGPNAGDKEVVDSQGYLDGVKAEFGTLGVEAAVELAYGDPVKEIIHWVTKHGCDLVAMSTHGHRFVADLVLGTTAIRVQHGISVPVLLLRAK
jgi:manganese transport protein